MPARSTPASRLPAPRIAPLEPADFDPVVQQILAPQARPAEFGGGEQPVFNVFRTLAAYPALMKRMSPWGNHLLFKSSLPPREREIVILRTGWGCGAAYEWAHHLEIALNQAGATEADAEAIRHGRFDNRDDQALIDAADQLLTDHFIAEQTWRRLESRFSVQQMMDLVFTVGHYAAMCGALNSFGVQLEPEFGEGA